MLFVFSIEATSGSILLTGWRRELAEITLQTIKFCPCLATNLFFN